MNLAGPSESEERRMKKVKDLQFLVDLGLSARTRTYLKKRFGSVDRAVWEGRMLAYELECGVQSERKTPKAMLELVSALGEAGMVWPAVNLRLTLAIGALYETVFHEDFVSDIRQLSNEQYESFTPVTTREVNKLETKLKRLLSWYEYDIVHMRFLEPDRKLDFEAISSKLEITVERARQLEARAFQKLRVRGVFPAILVAPEGVNKAIGELKHEYDTILTEPAVKKEHELLSKLEWYKKMPCKYPRETCEQLGLEPSMFLSIDVLGLSVKAHACLKHLGMDTVIDIIRWPNDEWCEVSNLDYEAFAEIVEKMHLYGYKDFNPKW